MKITKYILFLWVLIVGVLITYVVWNDFTPLGYDHGAYRHYMWLIEKYWEAPDMAVQFESFFDPTIKALSLGVSRDAMLIWGYTFLYILTSISAFIIGKKENKYTMVSYIAGILVMASLVQYRVFWVWLGKEMFATFLLLLSLKYYKNIWVYIILTAACIGLHRLTWIFSIFFMWILYFNDSREWKQKIYMLIAVLLWIITYIPTLEIQIIPLISWNLGRHILIQRGSWSLFGEKIFWSTQIPGLIALITWIYYYRKIHKKYPVNKKWYFFLLTMVLVVLRISGHTRIGAFFDLFLILYIAQIVAHSFKKKYILILVWLQTIIWCIFTYQDHTPTISTGELSAIKNIKENMTESKYLVNFYKSYGGWILGYSDLDIDSLYGLKIKKPKTKQDKIFVRNNPDIFCQLLHEKKQTTYIFMGDIEKSIFPQKATCIKEVKTFANWAKLFIYRAR